MRQSLSTRARLSKILSSKHNGMGMDRHLLLQRSAHASSHHECEWICLTCAHSIPASQCLLNEAHSRTVREGMKKCDKNEWDKICSTSTTAELHWQANAALSHTHTCYTELGHLERVARGSCCVHAEFDSLKVLLLSWKSSKKLGNKATTQSNRGVHICVMGTCSVSSKTAVKCVRNASESMSGFLFLQVEDFALYTIKIRIHTQDSLIQNVPYLIWINEWFVI